MIDKIEKIVDEKGLSLVNFEGLTNDIDEVKMRKSSSFHSRDSRGKGIGSICFENFCEEMTSLSVYIDVNKNDLFDGLYVEYEDEEIVYIAEVKNGMEEGSCISYVNKDDFIFSNMKRGEEGDDYSVISLKKESDDSMLPHEVIAEILPNLNIMELAFANIEAKRRSIGSLLDNSFEQDHTQGNKPG